MKGTSFILLVTALLLSSCAGVETDAEMMRLIQDTTESCEIDIPYAFVRDCAPFRELREHARNKPFPAVLGTLSVALNDDNPAARAVASNLLYGEVKDNRHRIKENAKNISTGILNNLIQGIADNKDYSARYAVAVTVYTATVLDRHAPLFTMLKEHPQAIVRTEGYPKTMTYGRLGVLPFLKEAAKADNIQTQQAVLQAPLEMFDYTEKEQNTVAEWMLPYLNDENTTLVYIAGRVLYNRCGPEYIDTVLDTVEKHIDATNGRLDYPFKYILDHAYNPQESEEQRARKRALMRRIRK